MQETIDYIKKQIKDFKPEIGIILGSGLGDFADNVAGIRIKYQDIPGFEKSTVVRVEVGTTLLFLLNIERYVAYIPLLLKSIV